MTKMTRKLVVVYFFVFVAVSCAGTIRDAPFSFKEKAAALLKENRNLVENLLKTQQHEARIRDISKRANGTNTPIAFTVRLSADIHNLAPGHQIHFDDIVYNHGHGYHNRTGKFNCPQDGVYKFSATMVSNFEEKTFAMMKNTAVLAKFTTGGEGFDQATQSIIVQCNHGDTVYMVPTNQSYTITKAKPTLSFSGYKLY